MTLWIILTVMAVACAIGVTIPLVRRWDAGATDDLRTMAIYKDQLGSIDTEVASGQLTATDAEPARVELTRRLLDVADNARANPAAPRTLLPSNQRARLALGVGLMVAIGATLIYAVNGSPDVPSSPAVSGQISDIPSPTDLTSIPTGGAATPGNPALPDVDTMMAKLEQRLQKQPDDVEGWRTLGWSYFNLKKYDKAAVAYGHTVELNKSNSEYHSAYGEALVMAANGQVTPQAKAEFETTLSINPADPRARFFVGLTKQQAGNEKAALDDWVKLLNDAPPGADWLPDLQQRTTALAIKLGIDLTGKVPATAIVGSGAAASKGPSPEEMKAAQALPASAQQAMINDMVDGLERRLNENPNDPDGWVKLMRSRMVLKQPDAAKQAFQNALKAFSADKKLQQQLSQAAKEAGVPGS